MDSRSPALRAHRPLAGSGPPLFAALLLAACAARPPIPYTNSPGAAAGNPSAAGSLGSPSAPGERPSAPSGREYRLGAAASALVAQAHTQASGGAFDAAGATLERALRIEPDNPLLWVELGRLQLQQGNAAQADGMGRKALALASGDPEAQAFAWRLLADSLRARGRNSEAADADQRANTLAPR